jgi:hypothetical protein
MPTKEEMQAEQEKTEATKVTPIRPIVPPIPTPPRRPSFSFPWSHAFVLAVGVVGGWWASGKLRSRGVRVEYDCDDEDDSEDE